MFSFFSKVSPIAHQTPGFVANASRISNANIPAVYRGMSFNELINIFSENKLGRSPDAWRGKKRHHFDLSEHIFDNSSDRLLSFAPCKDYATIYTNLCPLPQKGVVIKTSYPAIFINPKKHAETLAHEFQAWDHRQNENTTMEDLHRAINSYELALDREEITAVIYGNNHTDMRPELQDIMSIRLISQPGRVLSMLGKNGVNLGTSFNQNFKPLTWALEVITPRYPESYSLLDATVPQGFRCLQLIDAENAYQKMISHFPRKALTEQSTHQIISFVPESLIPGSDAVTQYLVDTQEFFLKENQQKTPGLTM